MELKIGLDTISNYKRLSYTPWHAIAEFIDNSSQSYINNVEVLEKEFSKRNEKLRVDVVYDRDEEVLRITDNSIGMSLEELESALYVGKPPAITKGRSKYGLGLKTASCWLGNYWTIKTKKLGLNQEFSVSIDVNKIANGENLLTPTVINAEPGRHYTMIEIRDLNRQFAGRTTGKIKSFLKSMYRIDLRNKTMELWWQGEKLDWQDIEDRILTDKDGNKFKKPFTFNVGDRQIHGWVGVLERGSRSDAGFSILQADRVIKGWPDSWRPSRIYGQDQGSNDLVNQRLFGEIHLDGFTVSHTKDSILWFGDEEDMVEKEMAIACADYREEAKSFRKNERKTGPSEVATAAAIDELTKEMQSPEMVDEITLTEVPEEAVINASIHDISAKVVARHPESFRTVLGGGSLTVKGYIDNDLSPNDPYVLIEAANPSCVIVIINQSHPHWMQLKDTEVLNYFRHCTYDGVAEWQARFKASRLDPNTIKLLKDKLLRIPFTMEENEVHREDSEVN